MLEPNFHTIRLSELLMGQQARILSVGQADLEIALIQLGVTPGDECSLANIAPLGDPIAIAVNGTKISVRRKDADNILVMVGN